MTDRPERREAARFCVNLVGEVEDMSDGEYVLYEDYDAIARENEELDRRLSLAEAEFSGGPSVHECIQTLKAERDRLQARVEELELVEKVMTKNARVWMQRAERAKAKLASQDTELRMWRQGIEQALPSGRSLRALLDHLIDAYEVGDIDPDGSVYDLQALRAALADEEPDDAD